MSRNKYGPEVIRRGAFPRPLTDGQVRGMTAVEDFVPRPNPEAVRTLTRKDIERRRKERFDRSTKRSHLAR